MSNLVSWASWASTSAANEASPDVEAPQDLIDLKQVALFDAIDRLGRLSLASDVEYPQLVVVGDQSCGKSSVLETIRRFHFPVSKEVCTRFPTKLVLRRSAQEHERVFIEPGASRPAYDRSLLQAFGGVVTESTPLSEWMQRASIVLGMSPATASDTGLRVASGGPRQFTDDVLVIEKYGCDLPLVNLVDLPGLFKAPDTTRQNEESQKMVFKMVQDYVRSQQNFILLVITARNTVYNHDGLNLVQEMTKEDPRLVSRVVGVVTNPDHALSLKETLSLLHGRHSSNVGRCKWHIVKNQDQTQRSRETLLQRDRNEEHFFLANDDWKGVPSELKGIAALHATLKDAFREHTRTALPSLMSKIQTKITTIDSGLRDLDCSRSTDHGRRQLLVKVAGRFAFFAREPCSGGYENPECKEFHSVEETCRDCEPFFPMAEDVANKDMEGQHTKLRANLRALNRAFSSAMLAYGKTKEMALASQSTSQPRVSGDQPSPHSAPPDQSAPDSSSPSSSSANPAIPTATYPAATTIRNYYTHNKPDAISPHEFEQSVAADLIPKSSGREPTGEASEAAYHALFIHQSSKWRQISGSHLKAVWEATEHFVQSALAAACPYPDLRDILEKRLIRPRIEALKSKSNRGLNDLLQCHSKGGTGFYDAIAGIKDAREKHEQQQTAVEDVVGSNEPDSDMQVGDMREESEDRNAIFDVLAKTVSDAVFDSLAAQTSIVSPIVLGPVREVVTQAVQGIVGSGFDLFVSATDKDKKMSTTSTEADAGADAPQEKQTAAGRVIQHVEENYETSLISFVGYVNALVAESGILRELPTAVFTPDIVMASTVEVINDIAGEKEADAKRRERDERDLEELRAIMAALEDHVGKGRF